MRPGTEKRPTIDEFTVSSSGTTVGRGGSVSSSVRAIITRSLAAAADRRGRKDLIIPAPFYCRLGATDGVLGRRTVCPVATYLFSVIFT